MRSPHQEMRIGVQCHSRQCYQIVDSALDQQHEPKYMQSWSLKSSCKIPVREIIIDCQNALHVGFRESESHFDVSVYALSLLSWSYLNKAADISCEIEEVNGGVPSYLYTKHAMVEDN